MSISIKKLFASTALLFPVYLLGLLLIQDIQAETVAEELRKKGEQCRGWVEAGDLRRDQASNCLAACERYGYALEKHPEILSDEGVRGCNVAYSRTKNKVPGMEKPKAPAAKAPNTIEDMIKDMNMAAQAWKVIVENASTSELKRQAETCRGSCSSGVKFVSRKGYRIDRAQRYWRGCTECKAYDAHGEIVSVPNTVRQVEPVPEKIMSSMPDVEGIFLQAIKGRLRVRSEGRDDWNKTCRESARVKDPNYKLMRNLKANDRVRIIGITYDPSMVGKGPLSHCTAERGIILGPSQ